MRFKKNFEKLAIAIFTTGVFVSCSQDFNESVAPESVKPTKPTDVNLVKTPEVVAWAGSQILCSSTRGEEGEIFEAYKQYQHDLRKEKIYVMVKEDADTEWKITWPFNDGIPTSWKSGYITSPNVNEDEAMYVIDWIRNNPDKGFDECGLINYYIQNVGSSRETYDEGKVGVDNMYNLMISDKLITDKIENGSNYNYGKNSARYIGVNLPIRNVSYIEGNSYTPNLDKQPRVYARYKFFYITLENGEQGCYLAINYNDKIEDEEYSPSDDDYTDWVIKLIPVDNKLKVPEIKTDEKNAIIHNNEVEVNLAILDSKDAGDHKYEVADLVTKLSIHVRKVTNVDIILPVPNKYVVESDDLFIFNQHYDGKYGGNFDKDELGNLFKNKRSELTYTINGQDVKLYVNYETSEAYPDGFIHVWTDGINENVISYCETEFNDGLNFEIYSYFQTEEWSWVKDDNNEKGGYGVVNSATDLTKSKLLNYLNNSVISFEYYPDYYINSFGNLINGNDQEKDPNHATVVPVGSWKKGENMQNGLYHLNGNSFNDIYYYTSTPDDAHIHGANGCFAYGEHNH